MFNQTMLLKEDVPSIYEVPLAMHQQNAGHLIKERLNIEKFHD